MFHNQGTAEEEQVALEGVSSSSSSVEDHAATAAAASLSPQKVEPELVAEEEMESSERTTSSNDSGSSSSGSGGSSEEEDGDDDSEHSRDNPEQNEQEYLVGLTLKDQDDPRRMRITERERNFALEIKLAIEADPELDNLSDFMYAQWAIVGLQTHVSVQDILDRSAILQQFRQEYEVRDTYDDGCRRMRQMFDLAPGQFLDYSFKDGGYVFVNDPTMLDSTQFTGNPVKLQAFMSGTHYFHEVFNPDFDAIRKGIMVLAEAEHWSWTKKQDFKVIQKQFDEFIGVYPFIGQCRFYNSGLVFNIMAAILRRILPTEEMRNQFQTGYKFKGMAKYYLVPDQKTANQRMFAKMAETLKRRLDNAQAFSLQNATVYRRRNNDTNTDTMVAEEEQGT